VSAQLREQGFRDALAEAEADVAVDESLVLPGAFEADVARGAAHRVDRPTAIFAASDQMALAVLEVAQELSIDVPADLSVVGFDNIPESALSDPR
jgi:LacI family transcriptional regulator